MVAQRLLGAFVSFFLPCVPIGCLGFQGSELDAEVRWVMGCGGNKGKEVEGERVHEKERNNRILR